MSTLRPISASLPPPRRLGVVGQRLIVLGALSGLTLAGVGGAVWQHRHHADSEVKSSAAKRLFSWAEPAQIERLALTNASGRVVVEHHRGEQVPWRVVDPQATAAEATAIDALLSAVLGASQEQEVPGDTADTPPEPQLFGLASPRMELILSGPDNQQERLEVGDKNTFNGSLYVRRGGRSEIVTCPASVEQALDKSFFDLRDKRVVTLPSTAYASIVVQADGATDYSLSKQADRWRLTAPIAAPANHAEAEALAGALSGLRAKRFVAEHGAGADVLQAHGLARPLYRATLTDDTQASAVLRVGRAVAGPSDVFYAQVEPAGPIVELGSDWVAKKFSIGLWELRDRHLASFKPDEVARISLREVERSGAPGRAVHAARTSGAAGDTPSWTGEVASGEPPSPPLDGQKVASLLQRLADMQAAGVVLEAPDAKALAKYGIDRPALEVVLEGEAAGDGEARPQLARLAFAAAPTVGPAGSDRLAAGAPGTPLWKVAHSDLDGIEASLAAFALAPETPPDTTAAAP